MYGLINISIKNLVKEKFGDENWVKIYSKSNLSDDLFVSNKSYDDLITYNLIGAATDVLKIPTEDILKEFGRYWVLNVAPQGYGKMLDACGKTYEEFLLNLPNFHTRVILIYPELRPPHFEVTRIEKGKLKLLYGSDRPGLVPFVLGLLDGLSQRFNVNVKVEYLGALQDSNKHEFKLELKDQNAG
jgi:hypothetical protein